MTVSWVWTTSRKSKNQASGQSIIKYYNYIIYEIDFHKVSYLYRSFYCSYYSKILKFNKTFEFPVISSDYAYNMYNVHNMFLLVSRYPDFLITSCIHAFENYVQSIILYGISYRHIARKLDTVWLLWRLAQTLSKSQTATLKRNLSHVFDHNLLFPSLNSA